MQTRWVWTPALVVAAVLAAAPSVPRRPALRLLRVPNGGIQPQLWRDGGTVHLLYFSGDPKAGDVYYTRSQDAGAAWAAAIRVNRTPRTATALGTIRGGRMALGRSGRVHVVWNGSSEARARGPRNPESGAREAPLFYSRLNDAGTAFEAERSLMTRTFGLDGGGTVAADREGNVYAAWHAKAPGAAPGEAGRQVWIAVSGDEGRTFAAEQPAWSEPTGACGCCGMALFAGRDGILRALYRSATAGVHRDIYLIGSADRGRHFAGRKLDTWNVNACPMSSMDFAEGSGRTAGAWETGGQVYFEDLTTAGATAVGAPGEGKSRKHPRLAIGRGGELVLVWTEATGWQRGGALAWQEFDASGRALGAGHSQPGVPAWSFAAVADTAQGFVIVY